MISLRLDIQEKKAFVLKEWTVNNGSSNLIASQTKEITILIQKTQVGREAKKMFQGFVRSAKFLTQSMMDKMPEEDKEALQLKLGQRPVDVMGNNNVQVVEEV